MNQLKMNQLDKKQLRLFEREITVWMFSKKTPENRIKHYELILAQYKLSLRILKAEYRNGSCGLDYAIEWVKIMIHHISKKLREMRLVYKTLPKNKKRGVK